MTLRTVVIFDDPEKTEKIKVGEKELLHTLGRREEAIAVQLRELFEAVIDSTRDVAGTDAQLTIEVSGSLDIKVAGGLQYLIFQVGGETTKGNVAKVSLTTTLHPSRV